VTPAIRDTRDTNKNKLNSRAKEKERERERDAIWGLINPSLPVFSITDMIRIMIQVCYE